MAVNPENRRPLTGLGPLVAKRLPIEAAVSNAIDGDALGPEEEKILIGQKWAQ